jgi:hypothetical protein
MVKGFELFQEHFKDHTDSFVIIGGTACSLLLEAAGADFRVTKDIDIILVVEVLKPDFGKVFWDFVKKGGYQNLQQSTNQKIFYRFSHPSEGYPSMLELFSSKPEGFDFAEGLLTPIPFDDEVSSLSAILLDGDYYALIQAGRQIVQGLPVLGPEYLIPLKAKAFLDLSLKREKGEPIDSKVIRKHQNDVFRLFPLLTEQTRIGLSASIARDMKGFLQSVPSDVNLKNFGINNMDLAEVLANLRTIYNL